MKRHRVAKRPARRLFSSTAKYVHPRNFRVPMRGGIRM